MYTLGLPGSNSSSFLLVRWPSASCSISLWEMKFSDRECICLACLSSWVPPSLVLLWILKGGWVGYETVRCENHERAHLIGHGKNKIFLLQKRKVENKNKKKNQILSNAYLSWEGSLRKSLEAKTAGGKYTVGSANQANTPWDQPIKHSPCPSVSSQATRSLWSYLCLQCCSTNPGEALYHWATPPFQKLGFNGHMHPKI